jgi:hypothetical protein
MSSVNKFELLSEDAPMSVTPVTASKQSAKDRSSNKSKTTNNNNKPKPASTPAPKRANGHSGGIVIVSCDDIEDEAVVSQHLSQYERNMKEQTKKENDRIRAESERKARQCFYHAECKAYKSYGPYCESCWFDHESSKMCVTSKCKNKCSLNWEQPGQFYRKCANCRYGVSAFPELS